MSKASAINIDISDKDRKRAAGQAAVVRTAREVSPLLSANAGISACKGEGRR